MLNLEIDREHAPYFLYDKEANVAGEKILIIGPEQSLLDTLVKDILSPHGFELLQIEDQEEALAVALANKPTLLLLRLPQENAACLLEKLEQAGYTIPSILIAESEISEIPVELVRFGVKDCIFYPFEADAVLHVIERVIGMPDYRQLAEGLDRINRKLEQRLKEFNRLFKVGRSVTSLLDLDTVLNRVTEAAVFITGAEEGYLLLLDEDTGQLLLRAAQNLGEKYAQGFSLPVSDSIAGDVVRTGKPVILGEHEKNLKVKTGYLVKSLLNVPLKADGRVIGVLGVANQISDTTFTYAHLNQLSLMADMATTALENAREHTEIRKKFTRQMKEFATLQAITDQLGAVTDFNMRARLALSLTLNTINAEAAVLSWTADGCEAMPRMVAQGTLSDLAFDDQDKRSAEEWWDNAILREVISKGQPILQNNQSRRGHNGTSMTRSVLAVPMQRRNQVVGAINFESAAPHNFTRQDLHFVTGVANQVAIALEEICIQEKAETNREQLLSLLAVMDDAVWLVDTDMRVVAQNKSASELWGDSAGEIIGHSVCDLLTPNNHAAHKLCRLIEQVMEERRPAVFDTEGLVTANNKNVVTAQGKLTPIVRENRVIGALCMFQKVVSERNDEFIRLDFANMASHLLRTPLSFIQLSIDLLMNTDLTPEERQTTLNKMWEQSQTMTGFTDELLEILRLEVDGVEVYIQPVTLYPLLEQIIDKIQQENPAYQFNLIASDTLPSIAADPAKIELILFNLLSNAVKRCPTDGGQIAIELEMSRSEINISITDNGDPIPANLLDRVFGQYYPIDDDGKMPSTYQLGLYTTKRLVELQNGRIWANSRPGHGSKITFSLPIWEIVS